MLAYNMAPQQSAQHFGVGPKKSNKTTIKWSFFRVYQKEQNAAKTISVEYMIFLKYFTFKSFWSTLVLKKCWTDWPNPAWKEVNMMLVDGSQKLLTVGMSRSQRQPT
jgi:hypothetical protein